MALGGGFWVTQNKPLPGTYHNFVSAQRAFLNLADRGYSAAPIVLKWGQDEGVFTVTSDDLITNSLEIFGYDYTAPELKGIRDMFKGASTVFFKKLDLGGTKASNDFATAKYAGSRGNDITTIITANVDTPANFDVVTMLGALEVDRQLSVVDATGLVDNPFVVFDKQATLSLTAGTPMTGGGDGTGADSGAPHQEALEELESYGFNTIACLSDVELIKQLYIAYTKRIRDEVGAKFQVVVYNPVTPADHEGVIEVQNAANGVDEEVFGLVYWTAGVSAGVNINASNTNKVYNGEHSIDLSTSNTQNKLIDLIKKGKYTFHRVGDTIRVLDDINSFTSFTVDKNEDFGQNQLIRIIDQIAIDTANLFNTRYLGKVPNDQDGRISLWNDILTHRLELQRLRAIQNYDQSKLIIQQGNAKNAVLASEEIEWTSAMTKLYITTVVA